MIPEAAVDAAWDSLLERGRTRPLDYAGLAAALEAASPHMLAGAAVTTIDELDALPFETVIRDAEGHILERWGDDPANVWVTMMVSAFIPRGDIALPATIIYRPTL